jgi:hypothetical protein
MNFITTASGKTFIQEVDVGTFLHLLYMWLVLNQISVYNYNKTFLCILGTQVSSKQ